ncbi:hypothetical protein [Hamadaea tsunoensis]|uniref:hypothetical protein n=1 Tax=Hamadaea tsunoensis TaxID=53368 RepID=UPI000429D4E7|nr:hypothetical protein [Hamadaea tsunoensis]
MVTIPVGPAAHDAWYALPEEVRAEARRLGEADQGHPDPAVAAVVVGWLRYEQPWPWWRNLMLIAGTSLFLGMALALIAVGGTVQTHGLANLLWAGPILGGAALVIAAGRWTARKGVPAWAEVPNILSFLSSPQAGPTGDEEPSRSRPRYLTLLAMAVGSVAVAAFIFRRSGLPLHTQLDRPKGWLNLFGVAGSLVLVGFWRRLRVPQAAELRRADIMPAGISFDGNPPVAWADVEDIGLVGPSAATPHVKGGVHCRLRDGTLVALPLRGEGAPPENLILAAAAHLA